MATTELNTGMPNTNGSKRTILAVIGPFLVVFSIVIVSAGSTQY